MSNLLIFISLSTAVGIFIALHAGFNLIFCLKPSKNHAQVNKKHGLVTVMIPARNEEKVIERCLRSLMKQDYPEIEIILYNDQSIDRTGHIADQLAKEDARICVIHGTHLPNGWVGKNHGCHRMSEKAQGHWYLFGDSDTNYEPDAISRALATAEEHNLEFISFLPRFDNYGLAEKVFLPIFYFYLFSLFPLSKVTSNPSPQVVAVNGSFILIKQSLYKKIGGHEAVKDKVLEDVLMGRHIKSLGHKVGYGDGSQLYSVHMYDDVKGIWEGFSKNAFSLFSWNYLHTILFIILTFLFCVLPFIIMIWSLYIGNTTAFAGALINSAIFLVIMIVLNHHLKQGWWSIITFPVGVFASLLVIANSMYRVTTGKGLTWKGRSYAK